MNTIDRRRIYRTALKVRHRMEEFARQFKYDDDLEGLCAISSGVLLPELKKLKVGKPFIAFNDCHAFCMIGDDVVVDVTATQFARIWPKVTIGDREELNSRCAYFKNWSFSERFTTVKQAHAYQKRHRWPASQRILVNGLTAI